MRSPADVSAIAALLRSGRAEGGLSPHWVALGADLQESQDQLVAVLAKAEASPDGVIRGRRHTILDDSDVSSIRHARGFVGGALAKLTGMTDLFVSNAAQHQGPPNGGLVTIIYRKETHT